jgi:Tfp pilus assembly protein PilF
LGLQRFVEAEAALRRALVLGPELAGLHLDLGCTLQAQQRLDEAAASSRRAVELQPGFAEAHSNLGNVLKDLGKPDEAVACYEMALQLSPDNAVVHNNLGSTLREQHRLDDAVSSYRRALALRPDLATVHHNLGDVLADRGELGEAVTLLGRAALKLDYAAIDWFYARRRICDWAGYRKDEAKARKAVGKQAFALLALGSGPAEQLVCARRAAAALAVPTSLMFPRAQPRTAGESALATFLRTSGCMRV